MHKKIIALISALAMGICSLTGCASNNNSPQEKKLDKITIAEVTHSVCCNNKRFF